MWDILRDRCPEPQYDSDVTDSSLSVTARLASPEASMLEEIKKTSNKTEYNDSGKDSDGSVEKEVVSSDDTDEECFEDCEEREYGWNYLHTIEEESEDEIEDEEEEEELESDDTQNEQNEQADDSGNDSDLEKSELETFEMLEQLCEQENEHKNITPDDKVKEKEKLDRGRILSYHGYKKVKDSLDVKEEYQNQIIVEKDSMGVKIKPAEYSGGKSKTSSIELTALRGSDSGRPLVINTVEKEGGDPGHSVGFGDIEGRMKHEPDSKIKSALKRAPSKKRKKHKVQFDESLNKFFDADYVILIREECGGGDCECGGGGDYCYAEDDDEEELHALDLTPFDPPTEFVDQLTLSPPDGYKDYCIHHTNDGGETSEEWKQPKSVEDGTTQTTPTSENEQDDTPVEEKKERFIVETITMTTVTERRVIREKEEAEAAASSKESEKEMGMTFKLGSNSLKPNSALRQLFPRIASPPPDKSPDSDDDSLQSNLIKRTIERNTLRRSLVRYPDLRKRNQAKKNENSLVERIKKLTCDIDEEERSSPTGEESKDDKLPAYKKITDIFIRNKEPHPVVLQTPSSVEHQYPYYQPFNPPDLGNGLHKPRQIEPRKQFLSSLAPLTACVSGRIDDTPGNRDSTSTVDTEYSLNDIDDVLKDPKPQPDVVAGTPGNENDELALFVQQDASRIERLKKRYSSGSDDEHDDYGFNRRPSVRGIKPRFGSTTEILQQMQSQITPPLPSGSHISWPYYPEDRNGYRRYVEEPHYSQNVIHVEQGQSVRLPYQTGPVQVHLMGPQRQVVVRGTQTISTYYQIPRYSPRGGPLVYYPRLPNCGSPTKMKLERGVPEGASASPHQEQHMVQNPSQNPDQPMMYAMNV